MTLPAPPSAGPLVVRRGPRAAEAWVLDRLEALCAEARREPRLLARPVRVVVPSASLRDHLAARLVARLGPVAGVEVQTLYALADTVVAPPRTSGRGRVALELLARRFAGRMPAIASALADLDDGLGSVVGSLRDLLDAGFTPAHLAALDERLAELARHGGRSRDEIARCRELARVAAAATEALAALDLARTQELYRQAADRLRSAPAALAARAVLVHGFANATGLALDLLAVLVERLGAEVVVDLPPDPAGPQAATAGAAFADRLVNRLSGRGAAHWAPPALRAEVARSELALVAAPGAWAEAWAVAQAVRGLLDGGLAAEAIGIVARNLQPYRAPLRLALSRLGVPFSAPGLAASPGAAERRARAVLALVAAAESASTEVWLAAAGPSFAGGGLDLALGLRSLGLGRLSEVAALASDEVLVAGKLPLPLREARAAVEDQAAEAGAAAAAGEEADPAAEPARLGRRALPGAELRAAVRAARELSAELARWPATALLGEHLRRLRQLFFGRLGVARDEPAGEHLARWLEGLAGELPAELAVSRQELAVLLRLGAGEIAPPVVGGRGAGVQLLSATAARGRTFDHLFVLGLNRDVFPRAIEEDPLLPDAVRRALRVLLPDLPVKEEGHAEEHYLFAQLLAAAPAITLSWQATSDDGEAAPLSPLLHRLLLARPELRPVRARHPSELPTASGLLPVEEWLVLLARHGGRDALWPTLAQALAATGLPPARARELAALRQAVLAELDPDLSTPEGRASGGRLGPYLGLVGGEETIETIYITRLEGLARCPWQSFLARDLGLEPAPDPGGPWPRLDGPLLGQVVHRVVVGLVEEAGGAVETSLAEGLERAPVEVLWPPAAELASRLAAEALRACRSEGVPLLAAALAARARVFLELLGELLAAAPWSVFGAELEGQLELAAARVRVAFRADLAELAAAQADSERRRLLTDLKTGRPLSDHKTAAKRQEHLLAAVARGEWLQLPAYLAGARAPLAARYLFLGRPGDELPRELGLCRDPAQPPALAEAERADQAFAAAAARLLAARRRGALVPRLLAPTLDVLAPACAHCAVREGCPQGDSGAVRRFARWVEAARREGPQGELARLALAVFDLGTEPASAAVSSSAGEVG